MKLYICLTLILDVAAGLQCTQVPGKLKQLDAGAGQVYGVNDADDIFHLNGNSWEQVPGKLIHVRQNNIFKIQDGVWVNVEGSLKQEDAGGNIYQAGVSGAENIYCQNQDSTVSRKTNLSFNEIEGTVKYYSCDRHGCWGVNKYNSIFYRLDESPTDRKGRTWREVEGRMVMEEVGSDGSVYGVDPVGYVYKREGISFLNNVGTEWSVMNERGPFKYVSYDNGLLWLLNTEGQIFKCNAN
ncbi:fish-egg lectin-like [Pelobates cultripes]|uniref:Fish-egg lectin-like n=1 Tax=Pelobates cultripes TaxID=61616 RepID=A0AAD1T724_PELCU|nr:fish-egg lectin-like [Pelobates cultripes]